MADGLVALAGVRPKKVIIMGRNAYKLSFDDGGHVRRALNLHKCLVEAYPVPLQVTKVEQHLRPIEIFDLLLEKVTTREKVDNYQIQEKPQGNSGPLGMDAKNPPPVVVANPRVGVKGVKRRKLRPCKKKMTKSKKKRKLRKGGGGGGTNARNPNLLPAWKREVPRTRQIPPRVFGITMEKGVGAGGITDMLEGGTMGKPGITAKVGIVGFPMEMHGGTMERARIGPQIGIK